MGKLKPIKHLDLILNTFKNFDNQYIDVGRVFREVNSLPIVSLENPKIISFLDTERVIKKLYDDEYLDLKKLVPIRGGDKIDHYSINFNGKVFVSNWGYCWANFKDKAKTFCQLIYALVILSATVYAGIYSNRQYNLQVKAESQQSQEQRLTELLDKHKQLTNTLNKKACLQPTTVVKNCTSK